MGAKGSRQQLTGGLMYVDELPRCQDERLQRKYERGMRGVLRSLTCTLGIFVALQEDAVEMCGAVTTKLKTSSASRDASTSGVKEASVAACRSAGDSIVVVVEHLGRDMPSCLNYLALRSIVRAMRDASDVVASGLKILSAEGKAARWIGGDYCRALEHFNKVHAHLPQALSDLANRVEDSRPLTEQLDVVKARMLSHMPSSINEHRALAHASRTLQGSHEAARARLVSAREAAEACWSQAKVRAGQQVGARKQELEQEMDGMIAPFVLIAHHIKGKSDERSYASSTLTSEEAACLHKYTSILLQISPYQHLEQQGGSIEDFLEALFLLGIAGGVGTEEGATKQAALGLSRKSLALLSDALESLDADGLRSAYTEWRRAHASLLDFENDAEFVAQRAEAELAAAQYLDAAKNLDGVSRDLMQASHAQQKLSESLASVQRRLEAEWLREFGEEIEVRVEREEA